jgi:hypothetical protein
MRSLRPCPLGLAFALVGCTFVPPETGPPVGHPEEPLLSSDVHSLAEVYVKGRGSVALEDDYLPTVVCCENGGAPSEALKAQAVMARTYVYFRYHADGLGTSGKPLSGTTADQAYFCANPVSNACRTAVRVTRDQIMSFERGADSIANVGFYVDGPLPACVSRRACACTKPEPNIAMAMADHPPGCDCFSFTSDGAMRSKYVTYNWSRAAEEVDPTTLGNPQHGSNHGCASQNIERCLAYAGWHYHDLLRFFYGQDIELRTTAGVLVAQEAENADPVGTPADGPPDTGCSTAMVARRAVRKAKGARIPIALAIVSLGIAIGLMRRRLRR